MASQKASLLASTLVLSNGCKIPRIRFNLHMRDGTTKWVRYALREGYRGFDCTRKHGNGREAGTAILDFLNSRDNTAGLRREDIFVTQQIGSKRSSRNREVAYEHIKKTVDDSGLGYIDLFLTHSAHGGRGPWSALEKAVKDGLVRMAGLGNHSVSQIQAVLSWKTSLKPVVNQIETRRVNTQLDIREFCIRNGIGVTAGPPLSKAVNKRDPAVLELAKKHSCTPAQLYLKFALNGTGLVTLCGVPEQQELIENLDVANLDISREDIQALQAADMSYGKRAAQPAH
ncbi:hypothetical protein CDD83_9019 [Cordyceps sp. RAO-2017]|nr:hypothetical protein CDD83_9019 [Cordyceps sp. RAO-2017]